MLRSISLERLPTLKSICRGRMVCDSLKEIKVHECPKLKRLPLYLPPLLDGQPSPPSSLKKIYAERGEEWWESLEWDHPNAKNVLQHLVVFYSSKLFSCALLTNIFLVISIPFWFSFLVFSEIKKLRISHFSCFRKQKKLDHRKHHHFHIVFIFE